MHKKRATHLINKLIITASAFCASVAIAMPTEPGMPVKKIPFADQISAWQALDKQRLIVTLAPGRNYLVTLRQACPSLRFTARVGVSSSNNTVYAGFDYITADGERCAIQRINEISKAEKAALSRA